MENMKNKYDNLGNIMLNTGGRAKTYENLNKSANEFIQATARRRIKRFQDQISKIDTTISNRPQKRFNN
jgi:hypothetical protein